MQQQTRDTITAEPAAQQDSKLLPARLVEEALAQDDQQLCLDEVCAPNTGSSDYELQSQQFKVDHVASTLPAAFLGEAEAGGSFIRQGVLPDIRHMWRSFDSRLVLWKYSDPRAPEVTEYCGVTQQIVSVATARPKNFVSGLSHFLAIATPVDVSLHAVRFAQGSDRLLPLVRTPYVVATDDTVISAIASDNDSGRIFLGGSDGCIHEFQYFDNEARWFGSAKRTRKSVVSWTLQSRLPTFLRKVAQAILGPAEGVQQVTVDSDRGLLFSLSSLSSVAVFQIPRARAQPARFGSEANAPKDEGSLTHLCSISQHTLASSVARIRAQLFPGLTSPGSTSVLDVGMPAKGSNSHPRLVKLLPIGMPQGGSIVVCAVAEDGTRIFLRGVFRMPSAPAASSQGVPRPPDTSSTAGAHGLMTSLAVHHVRFLDMNVPGLSVKDAIDGEGITLLLSQLKREHGLRRLTSRVWSSADGGASAVEPPAGDIILAISADLRAVAQRQSRGRSPWLSAPPGLVEHASVIPLEGTSGACQVVALASFSGRLPQLLQSLYSSIAPSRAISPVLGLSELAREQLLPPQRFLLVSNLGVHTLTKVQPLDMLRERLLKGDKALLQDFSLQYTAEQTCALGFQMLADPVFRPSDALGSISTPYPGAMRREGGEARKLGAGTDREKLARGVQGSWWHKVDENRPLASLWCNPDEEQLLLHAERLLFSQQLAAEMGFVQAWPLPGRGPREGLGPQGEALGHVLRQHEAHSISGRLRGLCLYVSRILRPLWLTPVMTVVWPARAGDSGRGKRRRDEWWPPPPEPPPEVLGAQWRCTWSKSQRTYVHGQLARLTAVLERFKGALGPEADFAGSSARAVPTEGKLASGIALLVATAIQALAFLDLIAGQTEMLSRATCAAQVLVRFAELTFRDLVCQPDARKVLQQLMRGGVVACRQLHEKCPQLFSVVDLEVQEAFEVLDVVQGSLISAQGSGSTMDIANLSHLVQQALRTLGRHAANVDLAEAATRLCAVGACKGLIALCAQMARARDPHDESLHLQDPTSARAQQLHYTRLECYQVILEVLENMLVRVRQHRADAGAAIVGLEPAGMGLGSFGSGPGPVVAGSGLAMVAPPLPRFNELPELLPMPVSHADTVPLLDSFLRHCLEGQPYLADELFHFCVLKWMLQRGLPVYRYDSPYVKGFLERHAQDQPKLLCRYYQHRGRWAEACDAYLTLARGSGRPDGQPPPIEERLVLLQSAALCAQMPGSNCEAEPIMRAMRELAMLRGPEDGQGQAR